MYPEGGGKIIFSGEPGRGGKGEIMSRKDKRFPRGEHKEKTTPPHPPSHNGKGARRIPIRKESCYHPLARGGNN